MEFCIAILASALVVHHVTVEMAPLVHVTHVHKHGLINF